MKCICGEIIEIIAKIYGHRISKENLIRLIEYSPLDQ